MRTEAASAMDINRDGSDVTLGKYFQTLENLQLERPVTTSPSLSPVQLSECIFSCWLWTLWTYLQPVGQWLEKLWCHCLCVHPPWEYSASHNIPAVVN